MEKKADITLKNDGLSPTAQEHAMNTNFHEQRTPPPREEKQPTEYVVDRPISSRFDGQRTLHRVRLCRHGLSDET